MTLRGSDNFASSRMLGLASVTRITSFICILFVVTCLASSRAAAPWMEVPEGIEVDPSIVWGQLPNGLRYVLKQQPHPPGATSLRMVVHAGFLHEQPDERGLAHFVEHMGFNGTTRFKGETLNAKMAQAGIRFGADVTAFTWPSHTIYQIDLPASDNSKLDLGVTVLREWASEIQFQRKQIDREKGVILSEHNTRGHSRAKLMTKRLNFLYPDSVLSSHHGLAGPAEIQGVNRDRLVAFYQKWYRPDNTVIVAAGDFDPAEMAALIGKRFSDWKRPTVPLPQIDIGVITNHPRTRATLIHDEEVQAFFTELAMVRPRPDRDSLEQRRQDLATSLAIAAVQQRLNVINRGKPSVFGQLGVGTSSPTPFASELSLSGATSQADWQLLCTTLLDEYRRLRSHGFLPGELEIHRRHLRKSFDFAVNNQGTRSAQEVAETLAIKLIWRIVPTTPEFDRELMLRVLPELTPTTCFDALRPFFSEGYPALMLTSAKAGELTSEGVAAFLNTVRLNEVEPPVVAEIPEFPYTDFGPPGAMAKRRHDEALDVHMIEFSNGVKLNLKHTDFEADTVYLTARFDSGGQLNQTEANLGIATIAEGALIEGGLGKLGPAEVQAALAGHFASLEFDVNEHTTRFRGRSDSQDVKLLLQLLNAYITDPAVRPEAVARAKTSYQSQFADSFRSIEAALRMRNAFDFFNEDPRFGPFAPQTIQNIDPDAVRAWLLAGFNSAPLEVGLVGDFDIESVIEFAAATIGTLPPRGEVAYQTPAKLRQNGIMRFNKVQSTERQAAINIAWYAKGLETVRRRRTLEILSWILLNEILAEVREKRGLTYSPASSYWVSDSVSGQGYLSTYLTVAVSDAMPAYEQVRKIADRLARRGIPRGSLERAREPLVQHASQQLDANSYWLFYVVNEAQTNPESLVMPHTRRSDLASITEAEVEAMAKEIIDLDRTIVLIAGP